MSFKQMVSIGLMVIGTACTEQKLHSVDGYGYGDGPAIEVDPEVLSFGLLSDFDDAVVQTFTITSVGAAPLTVSSIQIVGDSASSFTLIEEPAEFPLPVGASYPVDVVFFPTGANELHAQAMVRSDDPVTPILPVDLTGEGAVPELQIDPDPLNFGLTYVGCEKDNQVTLTNVGTSALTVTDISHTHADFTLTQSPAMPFELQPNDSETVSVQFAPTQGGDIDGELQVSSTEPLGTRLSAQLGTGELLGEVEEIWEFDVDPPSDILFAVDHSCSMGDDAMSLSNNFSAFINQLSNYSSDWQIMHSSLNNGCNVGGVLSVNTPNYEQIFQDSVTCMDLWSPYFSTCLGGGSDYEEALLTVAKNAIENTDPGECNSGFLRSNAMLHVVLVSDEPEQSFDLDGISWQALTDQIIAKKGSVGQVRISAIAGPVPGGCDTGFNSADPGDGYWEAVNYTNGVFLSICDNWSSPSNLQLLAEASVLLDSYPLGEQAVEGTVRVYVNGSEELGSWTYDPAINAVVFDHNAPQEGDVVRITYSPFANCD